MNRAASAAAARLKVGVVGAGYFSQFHLQGWNGIQGVELAAVCDADLARAQAAAKRFQAPHGYADPRELFTHSGIDLLDIVTPPSTHAALIRLGIEHRVPIICQKPFCVDYGQAQLLTTQAQAAGVPLVVHENFRFMPWYRQARKMIEDGMLGRLHGISFRLRPGDGQGPDAYLDRQPYFQTMPRLLVAETAIHFIDLFRFLMGEVRAVYGRLRRLNPVIAGEDNALIVFEFEGGAAGVFDGNRLNDHVATNPRRTMGEMWIDAEAGVLRLDGDGQLWFKSHHGPESACPAGSADADSFGGGACEALQRHVVNALARNEEPENSAAAYLRNLQIQEAVYASHATGQRIELERFVQSRDTVKLPL